MLGKKKITVQCTSFSLLPILSATRNVLFTEIGWIWTFANTTCLLLQLFTGRYMFEDIHFNSVVKIRRFPTMSFGITSLVSGSLVIPSPGCLISLLSFMGGLLCDLLQLAGHRLVCPCSANWLSLSLGATHLPGAEPILRACWKSMVCSSPD